MAIVSYFPAQFIFINLLIIIINRLSLWVYLGFIVHCGDRELFSRTMQLTHHTFKCNLGFLMNCGDRELFSCTMQLTHHTFKVNLGFLLNCGDRELFFHIIHLH